MEKGFSKVTRFVFALMIITSLVLISCRSDTATAATTPPKTTAVQTSTPKVTPQYGGTLIVRQNLPVSLGYPAKITGFADLDAAPICTDTLFHFGEKGKPIPWLATSWKYSSDLKSLSFTLRKDVKFQDGTDFNAAAVKTNLDLYKASKRGEVASVSSVDVVDNYTVRLNLSQVDAFLLPNLAEISGIMISPAALAKGEDWCRTNPVGTGPFKQVEYAAGSSVKYVKWEGYWQKGKPYLDAVQLVNIPDEMTAAAAFKKGEINLMQSRDPLIVNNLKDVAKVTATSNYLCLVYDSAHQDSPLSDIRVRQAIAYAIDSNIIQNSFGTNYSVPSNHYVNKQSAYYDPNIIGYPYNLQRAKDLLAASRYPKGFKMNFSFSTTSNVNVIATAIQSMLSKIGIDLILQPLTSAAETQKRVDGWQNGSVTFNFGIDYEYEPGRLFQNYISSKSLSFRVVARSAQYDTILSKIIAEPDFDKRVPLNQQLLKQIVDVDCMIQGIYNNGFIFFKSPGLNGENRGDDFIHQWQPQDGWYSK